MGKGVYVEGMGDRLRTARRRHGWTQRDLADRTGVGLATVRRVEQRAFEPRLETARRLADALGVRHGWLVSGEEPERQEDGR